MPAVIYGAEKDVYATGTQQLRALGQKMLTPDGSVFRYAEMAGTIGVANKLYQSAVPTSNWDSQALATAMTLGDTTITVFDSGTAAVADQLAGGTIVVEEPTDLGHIYRVKSNTATAANETVCTLEDGVTVQVTVAVAAGNVTTTLMNPFKDIVIYPGTKPTAMVIGVPRVVIAANAYGWIQTRGPASCLVDGSTAILVGNGVRPSKDDVGAVELHDETAANADFMAVGYAMTDTIPDTEFGHIFLALE